MDKWAVLLSQTDDSLVADVVADSGRWRRLVDEAIAGSDEAFVGVVRCCRGLLMWMRRRCASMDDPEAELIAALWVGLLDRPRSHTELMNSVSRIVQTGRRRAMRDAARFIPMEQDAMEARTLSDSIEHTVEVRLDVESVVKSAPEKVVMLAAIRAGLVSDDAVSNRASARVALHRWRSRQAVA